ncbi:MAG: OsmC family protein [candidate division WOR-3 bacterium]|jgi:uncharacterized OsmC-like protein
MNNVNIESIKITREKILNNELPEKRSFIVEGEWIFDKKIQFMGKIEYPNGITELSTDQPPISGGYGNAPNPVQICAFGMISCYSTTFMTIASQMGIEIKKLKAIGYVDVNMKSVFDIEDSPVVEKITIELEIETNANKEIIEEIRKLANKKCPAAYVIQNQVPFETRIKL